MKRVIRYLCGFKEVPLLDDPRSYAKQVDVEFPRPELWLTTKSFGVSMAWLRRWRYRLLIHVASFMGEATLFQMMHGPTVPKETRTMLSSAWVRHVLWHRAQEATSDERQELVKDVLVMPLEALIAKCWKWYGAMMRTRRLLQLQVSGDRDDIVAIDGNAKMHRRTCGMPFAEVVDGPELGKKILPGCPNRPEGQGTLSPACACFGGVYSTHRWWHP